MSQQDRVNVIVTRNASGKITAEVESLKGKGQAVVARRKVTEKHGPAGALSFRSETGDFVLTKNSAKAEKAHVSFKKKSGGVQANVSCRSGSEI